MKINHSFARKAVVVATTLALTAAISASGAGAANAFTCSAHGTTGPICIPAKR
ncbi:hypothetical protein [Subtercola boreus]|uniref:hypothetical protein n=1 Tax=Subtercola boreus TaxID=120213 RepID=UPI00155871C5|nr:hypothetical protein [Subtercola boreus]